MEQNLHKNDPWSLMAKVLASEASEAEKASLQLWLEEDPLHRQEFEQAKLVWQQKNRPPAAFQPNTDKAWAALNERLPARKRSLTRPLQYLTAVAAAALILLLWKPWDSPVGFKSLQTQGLQLEVSLDDGSQLWLNQHSHLQYSPNMADNERRIRLQGEAFFEVARDEKRPFIIEAGDARVQVLGTSFNVRAYPGTGEIELSVKSGKVLFFKGPKLLPDSSNARILVAGQQAVIGAEASQPQLQSDPQPNYLAWRDKTLRFEQESLDQVLDALSRYYSVSFEQENPDLAKLKFHSDSVYKNVPLALILEEIEIANPGQIHFEKKNDGYLVK